MAKRSERTVLFLCTGNYYRSRFAEILFNSVAGKMGMAWQASSRGLALERGVNNVGPMAVEAITTLKALGVHAGDAVTRLSAQVTTDDLEGADRVVALKQAEHLPLLQERFPAWAEKVEFWHVDDAPKVLGLIEQEVMRLVARILSGGERQDRQPTETPAPERPAAKEPAKKPVTVKVGRETAGRRGKGVTTVFDVPLDESGLRDLAATLKQRCGTGGTVKDGRIEIQGDQRQRIVAELEKLGYKVKRVGAERGLPMAPLYHDLHFTFRCADDRLIPRFHLESVEAGRRVSIFKIDPGAGERLGLPATAAMGDGGWVDLSEPIIMRAGEAFIGVPERAG